MQALSLFVSLVFNEIWGITPPSLYNIPCFFIPLHIYYQLKNLPANPPKTRPATPDATTLPTTFDALPNLSHLLKAKAFVMVKIKATTTNSNQRN